MNFHTFNPFGYEGQLCTVEVDTRRGIPAVDIVGIADSSVTESRMKIKAAIQNSGLQFPPERVLISISPADIRKEGAANDFAIALATLAAREENPDYSDNNFKYPDEHVLVLGELDLSGQIRPVRGVHAAVTTAYAAGIKKIICSPAMEKEVKASLNGDQKINLLVTDNLGDCVNKMKSMDSFVYYEPNLDKERSPSDPLNIQFPEKDPEINIDEKFLGKHKNTVRAIEIAVAGKHNLLLVSGPGYGKTLLTQSLVPVITPKLTEEESMSVKRIYSLAGLVSPDKVSTELNAPYRMPHPTASIEGICGGGTNCRPGEISLAHNGVLILDEAAEFRTSVLQMLRVPLENGSITLSRAGRTTVFPAHFQLIMTSNPSSDGNYMVPGKVSLDSKESLNRYWNKFGNPLLDRVAVQSFVYPDEKSKETVSVESLKKNIANAYKIQRKNGAYNQHLSPVELKERISDSFTPEMNDYFAKSQKKYDFTPRRIAETMKVALTIANLDNREKIQMKDLKEAINFTKSWKEQAIDLNKKINREKEKSEGRER